MSELNFTGNALKGSRAIVSFDKNFDLAPSSALIKEMLLHTFSVPAGTRKSKPFIDRVVSFSFVDGKVYMRHYQIQPITSTEEDQKVETLEKAAKKDRSKSAKDAEGKSGKEGKDGIELIEIGPRFVMTPIVILEGSFGGPKVYENAEFVSPNTVRATLRQKIAHRAGGRDMARTKRSVKKQEVHREQREAKAGEINDATLFA